MDFLRKHGAATVTALMVVLPSDTRIRLRKRLGDLERSGWLQKESVQGVVVWSTRPAAQDLFVEEPPPFVGVPARPRHINVMSAPVYTPPHDVSTRQGACDFQRMPSRGVRC